jgi:hypothetical protein
MNKKSKDELVKQLVLKSREAFIMGLEIYNKPTLKYRVEGFAFFVCNAWELMLKAEMVQRLGETSIYYKDNPERTISISEAIKKILTNDKDPLRKNLEKIIELRNTGTHFITEEYGIIYAPLFQACVINFRNKMNEFHNVDIAENIPESFLTLSVNIGDFTDEAVRAKYTAELAEKLIAYRNDLAVLEKVESNPKFSIGIRQEVFITKKKGSADFTVAIDGSSDNKVKVIKELKDPSNTHNFSFGNIVGAVNKRLANDGVAFSYTKPNGDVRTSFTTNDLTLFIVFYDIKNNVAYSYAHKMDGKQPTYSYAPSLVEFIMAQIKKDPVGVIDALKPKSKSR